MPNEPDFEPTEKPTWTRSPGGSRYRRSRTKQPKHPPTKYMMSGPGPCEGLWLEFNPTSMFGRSWVLGHGQLVIAIFNEEPKELWIQLTSVHRQLAAERFVEPDLKTQDRKRRIADEQYRTMEFWERVGRLGRKHHSRLRLND